MRAYVRPQVRAALRLEGQNETAYLLAAATAATANTAADSANVPGNENPIASVRTLNATRDASSARGDPITAASIFGDTLGASGGGSDGRGRSSSLNARRMSAARASKLTRAEAEAYADVQVRVSRHLCRRLAQGRGAAFDCACSLSYFG